MPKKISIYSIIKKDDRLTLNELIQEDPTIINNTLKAGHDYFPLPGSIAYDSRKCFDLLIKQNGIKYKNNYSAEDGLTLSIQKAIFDDNYYYFDKMYEIPNLNILCCLSEMAKRKYKDYKSYNLFKKLMEHPNAGNSVIGYYSFSDMIGTNKLEYIKLLLNNCKLKDDCSKLTVLMQAIDARKFDITKMLIEDFNVDVNEFDKYYESYPLINACITHNQKMIKYLLSKGANPNLPAKNYRDGSLKELMSPLLLVVWLKFRHKYRNIKESQIIKLAKLLISAGADVNYKSDFDITPVKYTIICILPTVLEFFIKNGADLVDNNLFLVLFEHASYEIDNNMTFEGLKGIYDILIKHNCNILCHNDSTNVLLSAMTKGTKYVYLVKMVIEYLDKCSMDDRRKYLLEIKFKRHNMKYINNSLHFIEYNPKPGWKNTKIVSVNTIEIIKQNWPEKLNDIMKLLN